MNRRSNGLLLPFFMLFCLVLAFSDAQAVDQKPQVPVVFISKLKAIELSDVFTYPARITPKVNTTLLAETEGVVSKIVAPLGQRVRAGAPILTITHTDPVYQYAPATVTAPVSGIVSLLDVSEGSQVAKGQKVGAVTDPTQIRVTVEVPAQDIPSLQRGMQGQFSISGRSDTVPVRIRGLSPFVDPATGTATCEIDFESRGKLALMPGIIGQVSFKVNVRKGISIPDSAVSYKGNETFVRLVEGTKARKVAVKLGTRQRGYVEVLDGLKDGMALVERSSRFVADGEAVVVQEQGPETVKQ